MTTVATVSASPAAPQLTVRLDAAAKIVPEARTLLDEGRQGEALATFRVAYEGYCGEISKITGLMGTVILRMKEGKEAGLPVNPKHVEELVELRVEKDAAVKALPSNAVTIGHAIFALDLLEA